MTHLEHLTVDGEIDTQTLKVDGVPVPGPPVTDDELDDIPSFSVAVNNALSGTQKVLNLLGTGVSAVANPTTSSVDVTFSYAPGAPSDESIVPIANGIPWQNTTDHMLFIRTLFVPDAGSAPMLQAVVASTAPGSAGNTEKNLAIGASVSDCVYHIVVPLAWILLNWSGMDSGNTNVASFALPIS